MVDHDSDSSLSDAFAARLVDCCTASNVRAIEQGESSDPLWSALEESGFVDALVPDHLGGAGLSLRAVAPLWMLAGRHALPVPFAETMLTRAILAACDVAPPSGPVAFGGALIDADGSLVCPVASNARTATHLLAEHEAQLRLLPIRAATCEPCAFELDLRLRWQADAWQSCPALGASPRLRQLSALVLSVQLSGAMDAVFERTLDWANTRLQFGRPIGKFQAIQHQLAILAEEAFAAKIAAQLACVPTASESHPPDTSPALPATLRIDPVRIAVAKARTSEAALQVAQLAHSIHGAIGFTREFDLQLYTRRLHAWRQAAGSESAWHDVLGEALIADPSPASLDFIRAASAATF